MKKPKAYASPSRCVEGSFAMFPSFYASFCPFFQKMQNFLIITTPVSLTGFSFYGYIPLTLLRKEGEMHITQGFEGF